jgi:deazaflavin-dependent oxidoreductase (nitroreductase family)
MAPSEVSTALRTVKPLRPSSGTHGVEIREGPQDRGGPMAGSARRRFLLVLKHTLNRGTTRLARSGHGPFSLVRHVGRRSGRPYETPVILAEVPGGFVTELTYGEDVDWYKNVLAAGGCTVVHRGREHVVRQVLPCTTEEGLAAFPPPQRAILRALRRHEFRLLSTR